MTANVLPDIDYSKLEELRKRLPDLSDIDITPPKLEDVGRRAEEAVDRLLGRKRAPMWPRVLAAIGLVAIVGAIAVWLTWGRRPGWAPPEEQAEATGTGPGGAATTVGLGDSADVDLGNPMDATRSGDGGWGAGDRTWASTDADTGLTAAEASLVTSHDPGERA